MQADFCPQLDKMKFTIKMQFEQAHCVNAGAAVVLIFPNGGLLHVRRVYKDTATQKRLLHENRLFAVCAQFLTDSKITMACILGHGYHSWIGAVPNPRLTRVGA